MDKAEFDKFAAEYRSIHAANIAISGESPDYFAEYKIKDLASEYFALQGTGRRSPMVLDFGSGIGTSVPYIQKYMQGTQLTCLDISTKSLEVGEARFPGRAKFQHFDGSRIPFQDEIFDIAFAACVFHHIDHAEHIYLLKEFHRVLVKDGMAMVFEHNPLNPLTINVVNTCPFDQNAHLIRASTFRMLMREAGFKQVKICYRVFFPHSMRVFRPLEKWLTWLPLGGQFYAIGLK
jgi:SAM-dependent methyltransferase